MNFYVYIIQSEKDNTFYFGQTNDLDERIKRHNSESEKYTRKKTPWKLFWYATVDSRAEAIKLERKLKNLKSSKRMMEFVNKYDAGPVA